MTTTLPITAMADDVGRRLQAATPLGVEPRVGVDLRAVATVRDGLEGPLRDTYLAEFFTDHEVREAGTDAAAALAACLAAKTAVLDLIATDLARSNWTDIEIRRLPSGRPTLVLYGQAALLARAARLTSWTVSLAQDDGVAIATVAALCIRLSA